MADARALPRLLRNGLTNELYIVTRYTEKVTPNGMPYLVAHKKYPVSKEDEARAFLAQHATPVSTLDVDMRNLLRLAQAAGDEYADGKGRMLPHMERLQQAVTILEKVYLAAASQPAAGEGYSDSDLGADPGKVRTW